MSDEVAIVSLLSKRKREADVSATTTESTTQSTKVTTKKSKKTSRGRKTKPFRCWPEPRYYCYGSTLASGGSDCGDSGDVVRVYVDGACSGNEHKRVDERIGGFGAWCEQTDWQHSGRLEAPCTNNRGELQAVIHVLSKAIKDANATPPTNKELSGDNLNSELRIMGDNRYVLKIATEWLAGWRARGYLKGDGQPPENLDLIKTLDSLLSRFSACTGRALSFQWVSAHSDEPDDKQSDLWKMWRGNKQADKLAVEGEQKPLQTLSRPKTE